MKMIQTKTKKWEMRPTLKIWSLRWVVLELEERIQELWIQMTVTMKGCQIWRDDQVLMIHLKN
ncbi:predicted protein [Nematostella vectensis]|uniref:Uncharacterized protein n=1 Tax=Nematostella vectensis TaxID=45351 RepID=A7RY35_NEMVE|nr:predicted protein [Nematostella vectensis]|eukprot:XP_001635633.1 predicted protein [Nematostella vectensis]